jgi:hypothetical protein
MPFDKDAVEQLSEDARVEVQDWVARRFLELRTPHEPERRRSRQAVPTKLPPRPRPPVWPVHGVPAALRSPWPASYLKQVAEPGCRVSRISIEAGIEALRRYRTMQKANSDT